MVIAISCVVGLIAVAAVVGVGLAVSDDSRPAAEPGYRTYPTTTMPTLEPTTTVAPTTTTSVTFSTPTTTATYPTNEPTTEPAPSGPQPVHATKNNPLHATGLGLPNFACQLARWRSNPAAARRFFNSAAKCLARGWEPVLAGAGLPFEPPTIRYPTGRRWDTPCGSTSVAGAAGFYCGYNHTIYMPYAGLQVELYGARPGIYLDVFAHEYGHAVQGLSGIMDAYWQLRYEAGVDTAKGLRLSRRAELQAQCFSGMFFGAAHAQHRGGDIDDNIWNEGRRSAYDRGDWDRSRPRDHGSPRNYGRWWEHGSKHNRTFQCNTWAARARDVS